MEHVLRNHQLGILEALDLSLIPGRTCLRLQSFLQVLVSVREHLGRTTSWGPSLLLSIKGPEMLPFRAPFDGVRQGALRSLDNVRYSCYRARPRSDEM